MADWIGDFPVFQQYSFQYLTILLAQNVSIFVSGAEPILYDFTYSCVRLRRQANGISATIRSDEFWFVLLFYAAF